MNTARPRLSLANTRHPAVLIKIPEIILLLIAIITFSVNNNNESPAYVASVLLPSLLNALVFMTVYLLGYDQLRQTPVELLIYSYTVLGLFISSILLLSRYSSTLIASGVFCLFLIINYCVEVYYAYTALVNRPAPPLDTSSPHTVTHQHPEVIPTPDPTVYPPPVLDTVDLGPGTVHYPVDAHHTNPVYPTTMNYPPHPMPDNRLPHFPGGPAP